jgi:hypothetical protein
VVEVMRRLVVGFQRQDAHVGRGGRGCNGTRGAASSGAGGGGRGRARTRLPGNRSHVCPLLHENALLPLLSPLYCTYEHARHTAAATTG